MQHCNSVALVICYQCICSIVTQSPSADNLVSMLKGYIFLKTILMDKIVKMGKTLDKTIKYVKVMFYPF